MFHDFNGITVRISKKLSEVLPLLRIKLVKTDFNPLRQAYIVNTFIHFLCNHICCIAASLWAILIETGPEFPYSPCHHCYRSPCGVSAFSTSLCLFCSSSAIFPFRDSHGITRQFSSLHFLKHPFLIQWVVLCLIVSPFMNRNPRMTGHLAQQYPHSN